jgi:hypothetical protein
MFGLTLVWKVTTRFLQLCQAKLDVGMLMPRSPQLSRFTHACNTDSSPVRRDKVTLEEF